MKLLICVAIFLSTQISFAGVDTKSLSVEMSAMTRTMDLLFARQEMKESLSNNLIHQALRQPEFNSVDPEVRRKVDLLTRNQNLDVCQTSYSETRSTNGETVDAKVEYKGFECPFVISATSHISMTSAGADGEIKLQVEIVSPKLKSEIDMTKFIMPMKIKVIAGPAPKGMAVKMTMAIGGSIVSQKLGAIEYSGEFVTEMIFGQGLEMNVVSTEIFNGAGGQTKFLQSLQAKDNANQENYFVNDKAVTKEIFEQLHSAIALPGLDDKNSPLEKSQTCELKTYDSAIYNLDMVRAAIKEKKIDSFKMSESSLSFPLTQTGKTQYPLSLSGQNLSLELAVTAEAARFNFQQKTKSGTPPKMLGRVTAVLGENLELTKLILDRVVRISCSN